MKNLDEPMNVNERYLYNINLRLNILIDMMSSFLKVYAEQNNMAVTYVLGSEEAAPAFTLVEKAVNVGFETTLKVDKSVSAVWSNNRVSKSVSAGFATKLKVDKAVNAGFQTFDLETLQIIGEI